MITPQWTIAHKVSLHFVRYIVDGVGVDIDNRETTRLRIPGGGWDVKEADSELGTSLSDGVVLVDALTVRDVDAHWAGEDEEQARRFGWYPRRSTIEQVRTFVLETERQWRESGPRRTWAIRSALTGALLGGCEARLSGDRSADVSWWIFPAHRGCGFASRAVRLMVRYAVDTLAVRRFVAFIEPDNLASRGVARNAGFAELELDTTGDRPVLRHELVC